MTVLRWVVLLAVMSGSAWGQAASTAAPVKARVLLTLEGRGVQIYVCKVKDGAAGWSFVRPEATLFDGAGVQVGTHGAGPVWVLKDGGSVRGKLVGQRASEEEGAVPRLLLEGVDGKGTLGRVRWVRRTETHGGMARVAGCDAGRVGVEDRVGYRATYLFYGVGE